jgi:hypothetical protein
VTDSEIERFRELIIDIVMREAFEMLCYNMPGVVIAEECTRGVNPIQKKEK